VNHLITRVFILRHWPLFVAVVVAALPATLLSNARVESSNLAINKPATCSSIENDEHGASRANDGNTRTCWRADDEPEGGPEWWQVDLQQRLDLSGCQIVWPYDGINYRCRVEGSADGKTWLLLSDQTQTKARSRSQNLKFDSARGIRYVRITITGFDEGCWASLSEVRVFGSKQDAR
jgi:hypothetical protein